MPLSPSADREPIHTRRVECRGYRRADGLWDVDAHLTDVKSYVFENRERGRIEPGTPIHEMWIRVTVDDDLVIHGIEAATDHSPFGICGAITPRFQALVGLKIGPGFRRALQARMGGPNGCTHLTELMGPLATSAFQTIYPILSRERRDRPTPPDRQRPPALLNSCHAFADTSPVTKSLWPAHYRDPSTVDAGD